MCSYAIFSACALDTFHQALYIWDDNVSHIGSSPRDGSCLAVVTGSIAVLCFVASWVLPLSSWLPFITLFCTLFMAHLGYLHLTSASLRCCNSSSKSPGVVQTDLALWVNVPMTLFLVDCLCKTNVLFRESYKVHVISTE